MSRSGPRPAPTAPVRHDATTTRWPGTAGARPAPRTSTIRNGADAGLARPQRQRLPRVPGWITGASAASSRSITHRVTSDGIAHRYPALGAISRRGSAQRPGMHCAGGRLPGILVQECPSPTLRAVRVVVAWAPPGPATLTGLPAACPGGATRRWPAARRSRRRLPCCRSWRAARRAPRRAWARP